MSYKAELISNNADLQIILDKVNVLPDAGGSSSTVETCEVIIKFVGVSHDGGIFYFGEDMEHHQYDYRTSNDGDKLVVVKNSIIYSDNVISCSDNECVVPLGSSEYDWYYAFIVLDNCTLLVNS